MKLFFSKKEFGNIQWEEKFKEFEKGGNLYDVSKIERTKDGYVIYCMNDSEEEGLVTLFKEWKKTNLPLNKTKIQFQPLFFSYSSVKIERSGAVEQIAYCEQVDDYNSEQVQTPTPPPR